MAGCKSDSESFGDVVNSVVLESVMLLRYKHACMHASLEL